MQDTAVLGSTTSDKASSSSSTAKPTCDLQDSQDPYEY